jgi:hypothetical protein
VLRIDRSKWRRGLLREKEWATTADEESYWALPESRTVHKAADLASPVRSCNGYRLVGSRSKSHSAVWICALALAGPFQKFAEASFCTDRHRLDTH